MCRRLYFPGRDRQTIIERRKVIEYFFNHLDRENANASDEVLVGKSSLLQIDLFFRTCP